MRTGEYMHTYVQALCVVHVAGGVTDGVRGCETPVACKVRCGMYVLLWKSLVENAVANWRKRRDARFGWRCDMLLFSVRRVEIICTAQNGRIDGRIDIYAPLPEKNASNSRCSCYHVTVAFACVRRFLYRCGRRLSLYPVRVMCLFVWRNLKSKLLNGSNAFSCGDEGRRATAWSIYQMYVQRWRRLSKPRICYET